MPYDNNDTALTVNSGLGFVAIADYNDDSIVTRLQKGFSEYEYEELSVSMRNRV